MPQQMPVDSVQMQMVWRYARILREQQAQYRGPRIGARDRRSARDAAKETAQAVGEVAGTAAQRAISAVKPPGSPAT